MLTAELNFFRKVPTADVVSENRRVFLPKKKSVENVLK